MKPRDVLTCIVLSVSLATNPGCQPASGAVVAPGQVSAQTRLERQPAALPVDSVSLSTERDEEAPEAAPVVEEAALPPVIRADESGPAAPGTDSQLLGARDEGSPAEAAAPGAGAATQMNRVLAYARANNAGASSGQCFSYVWRYLTTVGYGKLRSWTDAAEMGSAYARNFADYMNRDGNAQRWGLRRLPIDNPYDAPAGAVVVVAPGSPGTSHPVAGDISVAAGNGRFINDGPAMSYGPPGSFAASGGRLLGAYVPVD